MKNSFSIAYLILCHKSPSQLALLIENLNFENVQFVIHVDKRINEATFRNKVTEISPKPNVYWCEKRFECNLGEYNLVRATLSGISVIIERNEVDYVVLISGQDFPIKSNGFINNFFKNNYTTIFLEHFKIPCQHWFNGGITRFPLFYRINSEIPLYGGSQWWSAPTFFLKEFNQFIHNNTKIVQYFEKVDIPDESFFQTIFLIVAKFKGIPVINNNYRFIVWGENEQHPKIFRIKDFHKLISNEALFARKFDNEIDDGILIKLSKRING